jgi:hypothetical protein
MEYWSIAKDQTSLNLKSTLHYSTTPWPRPGLKGLTLGLSALELIRGHQPRLRMSRQGGPRLQGLWK